MLAFILFPSQKDTNVALQILVATHNILYFVFSFGNGIVRILKSLMLFKFSAWDMFYCESFCSFFSNGPCGNGFHLHCIHFVCDVWLLKGSNCLLELTLHSKFIILYNLGTKLKRKKGRKNEVLNKEKNYENPNPTTL